MKNKIKNVLYTLRALPILIFANFTDEIKQDIKRWRDITKLGTSDKNALAWFLVQKKEFRNIYIYRNKHRPIYRALIKLLYPPIDSLFIEAYSIKGGLFIHHGFATMITARSIGENCWINQQVTIGYRGDGEAPIIGDNVTITCGAKVLGEITVGNGAVIGANAVVIHDVEEDAVMVGVPAKRVK